jgi:four helix bundle protein
MNAAELQERTQAFVLRVIRLVDSLPSKRSANAIANQLVRSATSVGANYRAVCRARSTPEFLAKFSIVVEEADETSYWLELIATAELVKPERITDLLKESNELLAIFARSRRTAKSNQQINKS